MKTRIQSLSFLATLAIALGMIAMGGTLHAQDAPSTSPDRQAQQPSSSPDTTQQPSSSPDTSQTPPPQSQEPSSSQSPSSQTQQQTPDTNRTPDTTAPSQSPSTATGAGTDSQVFSGTVVKSGDKYVLKDDTGHTYDIDHQDEVKKFEGKRVRVQGTLDPTGNKIMVK